MLKKNFSLVLSIFVITSVIGGCGGRPTLAPLTEETAKTEPANVTAPAPAAVETKDDKDKIDREIITILAEEGLALTEEGIKASGIFNDQNAFSTKAGNLTAAPGEVPLKLQTSAQFYVDLRGLWGLKGKERKDYIADLKKKYPYYFANYTRRLCYVMVPKFRYCNEDGS